MRTVAFKEVAEVVAAGGGRDHDKLGVVVMGNLRKHDGRHAEEGLAAAGAVHKGSVAARETQVPNVKVAPSPWVGELKLLVGGLAPRWLGLVPEQGRGAALGAACGGRNGVGERGVEPRVAKQQGGRSVPTSLAVRPDAAAADSSLAQGTDTGCGTWASWQGVGQGQGQGQARGEGRATRWKKESSQRTGTGRSDGPNSARAGHRRRGGRTSARVVGAALGTRQGTPPAHPPPSGISGGLASPGEEQGKG